MRKVPGRRPWMGYAVAGRGRVVEARKVLVHGSGRGGVCRGEVTSWSKSSRARMCRSVAARQWRGDRRRLLVTLTFAAGDKFDGRRELGAFRRRWGRRWGRPYGVWWREFQARGTVHYHLLLEVTPAQQVFMRRWVAENWRAVGGGFTDVSEWLGKTKALWQYAMKEVFAHNKDYQHKLPAAVSDGAGRWWGVWGSDGRLEWCRLTEHQFLELRRRARRWGVGLESLHCEHVRSWWAVAPPDLLRGLVT